MSFYVRVATRGSAMRGTPRQALNYITDGHDARRDPSYSDAELHYIARMDQGWKTDLEGGRVPLAGLGTLAGEANEKKLAARFEHECQPWHDIRGTTGYKSITLTVPKEVSLYAEGHRQEAKAAINAAVKRALDRAFAGLDYSAVAAIHTRNQVGEIHYHVHVLVAKFARDVDTNRMVSVNSKAGGNGPKRVREMKAGWQEGIEKEFLERLQLGIEQKSARSPVALVLPSGERLEPLNRDSRRVLEKELSPTFKETLPSGQTVTRQFRWSAMDDRIFEVASGARGTSGWSMAAFKEAFPEQLRYASRYEARVKTLQAIGYLTTDGRIAPAFRLHFCVRHGVETPELQQVRIDLQQRMARDRGRPDRGAQHVDFWSQLARFEGLRKRVERLGYSRDEVNNVWARAATKKPTREPLALIRAEAERKAALSPAPRSLPQTKTILRAYVDLQKSKVQRIYLITSGVIQFWKFSEKRALAAKLMKIAERDLFFAKEKRLAQVARALRPVIWLVRIAMPQDARRLEQAMLRCSRLAQLQRVRQAGRAAVQQAYEAWRADFIKKPLADLKQQREELRRPEQQAGRERLEQGRVKIRAPEVVSAAVLLRRGRDACSILGQKEAKTTEVLRVWRGREEELVEQVFRRAKGEPSALSKEEYEAAVRCGQVGRVLELEGNAKPVRVPEAFAAQKKDIERLSARLQSLGLRDVLTPTGLGALSPAGLRRQLDVARKARLLDEGPAWTFKAAAARQLAQDMTKEFERNRHER